MCKHKIKRIINNSKETHLVELASGEFVMFYQIKGLNKCITLKKKDFDFIINNGIYEKYNNYTYKILGVN